MSVAAILVNYNGGKANLEAIESLRGQADEIVVVDNASQDGSAEEIRARFGDGVKLVQSTANLGFGKACNLGVASTRSSHLLFFNNDAVANAGMVAALTAALDADPGVGIVGPVVFEYAEPDVVQSALPTIDLWGFPIDALTGARRGDPRLSPSLEGFYVPGCALLIRRELFDRLHGFDEGMFMFVEDVDLCWRAQILGYGVRLVPGAECRHVGGGTAQMGQENGSYYTSELRIRLREQNTMRMMLIDLDGPALLRYLFLLLPVTAGEAVIAAALRKGPIARAYFEAFGNVLRDLTGIVRRRKAVQATRRRAQKDLDRVWSRSYGKLDALRRLGVPRVKSFTRG